MKNPPLNLSLQRVSLNSLLLCTLVVLCFFTVGGLTSCSKVNSNIDLVDEEPGGDDDSVIVPGVHIASITGSITQGGTVTLSGSGFTTVTDTTLFFTDFENGTLAEGAVGSVPWLKGDGKNVPGSYIVANNTPLTGTKVARAAPTKTSFGDMYAELPNLNECFVEFFYRYDSIDFTASPDAPQIKHSRLTSGSRHTDAPFLGLIVGAGVKPNMTYKNDAVSSEQGSRYIAYSYLDDKNWHRDTYYRKNSTPGVADGISFIRTTFGNQWTTGGKPHFVTPNEWDEAPSITRGAGSANTSFKRFFFPFYHRAQQTTIVDINHIYIHNSRERVYLSTSPTATASTTYKHVVCPTTARSATGITFKSMIGCLPANAAVYLYVVNDDNEMNENGFLIRSAS